jgi:O-acetyl-ADP-ribose deacetylase (regulator of RNase III)
MVTDGRIRIVEGDITRQAVDAIVNAANTSLLGGGGVDGAIHRAAGRGLLAECRTLGGCATGAAKITRGYNLQATHIIHTVGPVWRGGRQGEDDILASCYRSCFALAREHGIRSIAFPAISTGIYGFPLERATRIALTETHHFLATDDTLADVRFVCFSAKTYHVYEKIVQLRVIGIDPGGGI